MKLSPPKHITFWISVALAALGVLATFVKLPILSPYAFWLVVVAFVLLAVANLVDGL
jgi:hypothetical protein